MKKEKFDLTQFTAGLVNEMQSALTQTLVFEYSKEFFILADRKAMNGILVLLLENAGRNSPKDSTIWLDIKQEGDCVDLTVTDEGADIPDAEKEKIFDSLIPEDVSQANEKPVKGFGLGIAKREAEKNGAWLFISDHLPHGAVFHLVFLLER
ncbi:MAG: ATP-binding protein [Streptococcaceae bacterium]|jgi:K+-sensing histidine kinase KdpD|nr:ATP-binding protein [Streptococcaceae bacterium]